ncbi:accessory gland protein Acp62F-like [Drosophila nasuta]|uniref:Accessory gland protein Acp62F-like n=1 Tax=Drosophila albomicans TaxID=7291 RepID=A0A6P8XDU9_DROAB|nr:accessory gland protein Acp62F-like [Drosophila albomicans]XP_060658355.1 accessory gland protein Acp62F-like [Drosophila nasuta]
MFRLLQQLPLLLLLCWWLNYSTLADEVYETLHHYTNPEPDRKNFIWNPFPGFCGRNATAVNCGGVCPETCAYKSLKCLPHCGVPCVCRSGYVFSESLLKCILRSDCPTNVQQQEVQTHRVFQ